MCAEVRGQAELVLHAIDADHLDAVERERRQDGGHPDTAEADDRDPLSRLRAAGVDDRATTGEHGAAEEGGDLGGHVLVEGYDGPVVDHGMGGEARDTEVVEHLVIAAPQAHAAAPAGCLARCSKLPGMQGRMPPDAQPVQSPQRGRKVITTRCPTVIPGTSLPTCSTIPAASWPSSIGTGRRRLPSTTERSEWHTPATSTRTSTSCGPGSSSSSSPMVSGRLVAYGRASPMRSRTAPWIFKWFLP